MGGKGAVVAVVELLVLHQCRAGEVVEAVHVLHRDPRIERGEQRKVLGERDRDTGVAKREKEAVEHRPQLRGWRRCRIITCSDRKSTRLNSSHSQISYAVFCLKKK